MTDDEKPVIGPEAKKVLRGMWDVLASFTKGATSAMKAGYRDGMTRWEARKR